MVCTSSLLVSLHFLTAKSHQNLNYLLDIHKRDDSHFSLLVNGHQADLLGLALYVLMALISKSWVKLLWFIIRNRNYILTGEHLYSNNLLIKGCKEKKILLKSSIDSHDIHGEPWGCQHVSATDRLISLANITIPLNPFSY